MNKLFPAGCVVTQRFNGTELTVRLRARRSYSCSRASFLVQRHREGLSETAGAWGGGSEQGEADSGSRLDKLLRFNMESVERTGSSCSISSG